MRMVPALDRGLRVLDLLATRREPMAASALARDLDIPRSAVYEIINTLARHGAVHVDDARGVSLGRQLFVLGSAYAQSLDLISLAQPVAHAVMTRSHETVQVGVLDGEDVIYLVKAESPQAIRLVSTVGSRLPAHCTALGKMLLAELPPEVLRSVLGDGPLRSMTSRSQTDPEALSRELADTKAAGLAWERGESNPEVVCVAAPVRDATGEVVAAMSISAPQTRLSDDARRAEVAALVEEGARDLSVALGHLP